MPIFSLGDDKNPISYWKTNYPDSEGVEILATLIDILEAASSMSTRARRRMYLLALLRAHAVTALSAEQKVELFKIVTGATIATSARSSAPTISTASASGPTACGIFS